MGTEFFSNFGSLNNRTYGEGVVSEDLSLLSDNLRYINLTEGVSWGKVRHNFLVTVRGPGIPHGTTRVLHVELCSEFTIHCTCSLTLNLVPGIVSVTNRD